MSCCSFSTIKFKVGSVICKKRILSFYAYAEKYMRIEKIRKTVKYGHELIIPNKSISPNLASTATSEDQFKYTLSGVIYHHGVSPSGGHYTCDVYDKGLNKWFRIDDVNVEEIKNREDVLAGNDNSAESRTAYILLYEKVK